MMPADCFYKQREKIPPSPLPSIAFSGSPVPSREPENAVGVSAS
ncbi:unnamed protein product [Staurois parvus]|uniref:Uncharacterized protein n=1 Tax=Staurois parvus TaxID=386267 RepID=A0ABN9DRP5_9NEOB|nr:unnamed protein product [Staurois parvus]